MKVNIPILYYHFINQPDKKTRIKGLYTTKKQFEWQMKLLIKNGFNFITFEDIVLNCYDENKRNIIITFDDGCLSLYENAFPIMKKYGIRGVVYVVADSIGKQRVIWDQNENKDLLNLLSAQQIREMAESGIEFGSHGNDHVHFDLLGEQEVLNELTVSKNTIETIINKQVYSVAYPFGSYNETTMKMANKAGYKFGTTTNSGDNRLVDDFELCRFAVKGYALKHYWYFCKTLKNITKN